MQFTLRRDAGRFDFTGRVEDGRGSGDFSFTPSADFVSAMGRLGYPQLSNDDVWRFAMHDVSRDYVTEFKNAGYQLDTSDLIKSRIHGATPAFAQQISQETQDADGDRPAGQDAHPRRHAGVHQADARSRLQERDRSTTS